MNREQQIEEMAMTLGNAWVVDLDGHPHDLSEVLMQCDVESISEQLYDSGYRKVSDIVREIFEDIKKFNHPPTPECRPVYVIRHDELVGLVEKYLYGGPVR